MNENMFVGILRPGVLTSLTSLGQVLASPVEPVGSAVTVNIFMQHLSLPEV